MRKQIAIKTPRMERLKTNQNSTGWTPSSLPSIVRPSTGTFPPYIDKDVKNDRGRSKRHL